MAEDKNLSKHSMDNSRVKKLLYVFSASPYSSATGQEGLDALLVGAAFEQMVSVLFLHDGVFQLKVGQDSADTQIKQFTKGFGALEDFGIENVFVFKASMDARGLSGADLIIPTNVLDSSAVASLIAEQHRVFTF